MLVNLRLPVSLAGSYTSAAQRARVLTEGWVAEHLYCPACPNDALARSKANTRVVDFRCTRCGQPYQLKSKSAVFGTTIVDGAYETFLEAVVMGAAPNLLLLRYSRHDWTVSDLMLVPAFAVTPSAIERRKPLASTARRAGWVGCNILLSQIPPDARIHLVTNSQPLPPTRVRAQYRRLQPLASMDPHHRGWTLDVLNIVRQLGLTEFTNDDVYEHHAELQRLHPENQHIRDKIRQQLQVLRDNGFLIHAGRGRWRIV